jgi:hypothetical protein
MTASAVGQQYRATCRAPECDWVFDGTEDIVQEAVAAHRAEHEAARPKRWRARCTWDRCSWKTTGDEQWVNRAWERHRAEHRAEAKQREERRIARYRWRGRPNPTQRRLLELVRAGAVAAYECRIFVVATGVEGTRWYPRGLSRRDDHWWPALMEAGLVRVRPTWSGGPVREGVWQLTRAGRAALDGGAA